MAAFMLGLAIAFPSWAENPFDIDSGNWTAFENYKQTPKDSAPKFPDQKKAAAPDPDVPAEESAPPPPAVSLFLTPAMPGLDKGFDIKIESTEQRQKIPLPSAKKSTSPDFLLPDKNWASPSSLKMTPKKEENEEENPLNVRMSFLPSQGFAPASHTDSESARTRGHEEQRKRLAQKKNVADKTPEVAAACEALDLYKKQQLDALQSDRETLKALQNAIHSLGLSKQLGYMSDEQTSNVWLTPAPTAQ